MGRQKADSNGPRLLLVEGKTDKRLLPFLLEANGIPWPEEAVPVSIEDAGGFEKLLQKKELGTFLKVPGRQAIGLIFDADEPEDRRWGRVYEHCRGLAPSLPSTPQRGGWIGGTTLGPRFGVWMMPDNLSRGYLETFLHFLVPPSELWRYTDEVIDGAIARGASLGARVRDKAKIHSWLAWQDEPGKQLHEAVDHKVLDPTSAYAGPFVAWFKGLFFPTLSG